MKHFLIGTLKLFIGLAVIAGLVLFAWYQIDGQPLPEAKNFLSGKAYTSKTLENGDMIFEARQPNDKGIVIFHGALIKPLSYAKAAAYFASRGYLVWIPQGDFRLSVTAVDRIAKQLANPQQNTNINEWFFIGHSMGGLTGLRTYSVLKANDNIGKIKAMAIWAGSMPDDFSSETLPLLFVSGDHDAMLPAKKLATVKNHLPAITRYAEINGANHKNFALYSHQFFDGDATIDIQQQTDLANEMTAGFFESL